MNPNPEKMDWTAQAITTLRTLWHEGHATAVIGRRMGVSKNTIVGKAHRLKLPPRPSPIRGGPRDPAPPAARAEAPIPSLPPPFCRREAPPPQPVPVAVVQVSPPPAPAPSIPKAIPAVVVRHPLPQLPFRRTSACQWPTGEPGRPDFRFCDAEPASGKPYCPDHCGRAYVRPRAAASAATAS